ncbi:hypothetical protein GPJ56_003604 [Histomonas meleagridis]|uniref:uncharacterized protein n=1 Tax=Histomonas meleagridis TaxID=135588 RepID=UPI00355A5180|nr:hypothetical protein GPJ56_003604 [Histomonas meleagridis]KAH0800674.1 hypothetical protein GO595_006427 [Histomonas meleagridis]
MLSAVNKIIVELNGKPEDIKLFFQWLSIGTRYNILKSQQYNFSPLLKANFSNDFSYPPLSSVKAHVQQFAPFNSMPRTVTFPVKYVTTTPIQTAKPPPKENKNKIPITLFPSNSPTSRVIQLFRYATSDYSQRNLQCCTLVLNQIRSSAPQTLFDCEIWRNKFFAVDDSESQVSCGFICYLLKDYNQAFICFRNAAELGSEVGCCMCGLMLFHENSSKREIKNGLYFFSRCKLDPIALIHMGVACNEKEWVKRATELTKMKYKSGEIYEYVGDLFFEGIKFPKEMRIAQMWYGYAIAKYEEYGFGIEKVSKKLASAVFLQESHS